MTTVTLHRVPEDVTEDTSRCQKFKRYPICSFYIDIAEVQRNNGELFQFVATDRIAKLAVAQLAETAGERTASEFLQRTPATAPCRFHTLATDGRRRPAEKATESQHRLFPLASFSMT